MMITNTWSNRGTPRGTVASLASAGLTNVVASRLAAKAFLVVLRFISFSFLQAKHRRVARGHAHTNHAARAAGIRFRNVDWVLTTAQQPRGLGLRQKSQLVTTVSKVRDLVLELARAGPGGIVRAKCQPSGVASRRCAGPLTSLECVVGQNHETGSENFRDHAGAAFGRDRLRTDSHERAAQGSAFR